MIHMAKSMRVSNFRVLSVDKRYTGFEAQDASFTNKCYQQTKARKKRTHKNQSDQEKIDLKKILMDIGLSVDRRYTGLEAQDASFTNKCYTKQKQETTQESGISKDREK